MRSCKSRNLDMATYVHPVALSDFPMSMTALSKVCPCDLWIVMAYLRLIGSCCLEKCLLLLFHSNVIGYTGTVFGVLFHIGPEYSGK